MRNERFLAQHTSRCWLARTLGALLIAFSGAAFAQAVSLSTTNVAFGGQSMGTTSPVTSVTLTNSGAATLNISSINASSQFSQTNNCTAVAPSGTCRIDIQFSPASAAGALNSTTSVTGTVTIASNAAGSPQTINLSGTGEKSLVVHYYRSILRRAPDASGKSFWSNEAVRVSGLGANVNETWYAMAQGFFASAEYVAFNRSDSAYVTDLYNTFFNRVPDAGGLAFWSGELGAGVPRGVVLVSFMLSPEFTGFTSGIFGNSSVRPELDTVVDYYRGILSRLPDDTGFNYWLQQFRGAQCAGTAATTAQADAISSAFVGGSEYASRNRTNAQFVGDMYNAFLRRGGDRAGVQSWINLLNGGATRDSVRLQFISSAEFQARVQAIVAAGCFGPPPASTRPRIWLGDFGTMSRLTAAANANTAEWQRLKTFCDTKTLANAAAEYQGSEPLRYAGAFALCYRIVRAISGATAAAPYAQKAINVLNDTNVPLLKFVDYSTDQGYGIRNYVPAMALILDWMYDSPLLTASLKTQIIARMRNWVDWFAANGYSNDAPIANYNTGFLVARVLAGIAAFGEDTPALQYYNDAVAMLDTDFAKFDEKMPTGHWPEGWSYGANVYANALMSASALKIFTNDPRFTANKWLSNNVAFKLSALSSDGKFFYNDGLWSGGNDGLPDINDVITAGYTFGWGTTNGKLARTYLNYVVGSSRGLADVEDWKVFLFYDPASQGFAPASIPLPTSYNAKGTDTVVMRSGWTTPTDTWASIVTGPYLSYETEQDMDQGNVLLYKGARLLLDVGHEYYSLENTKDHNTITLEGRTDTTYSGQDQWHQYCPNPLGTNPIGQNAYSEGGSYTFVSGEFSAAYQIRPVYPDECGAIPVTWLNRSLLFVKPDVVLVYDQVQKAANQANLVPLQHWHLPAQPTAQAGTSNRQLTVDNAPGRMHFASILPANTTVNVTFNAKNTNVGPGVANYHVTVRHPSTPTPNYQAFLTMLRAGQNTPTYVFPTLTAIQGTNASGVLITGLLAAEAPGPVVGIFADNGALTMPTSLQYSYTAASAAQNYVAKLKPNTFYTVSSSGSGTKSVTITEGGSTLKTDAGGVLVFTL